MIFFVVVREPGGFSCALWSVRLQTRPWGYFLVLNRSSLPTLLRITAKWSKIGPKVPRATPGTPKWYFSF